MYSNEKMELLNNIPAMIIITDKKGKIIFANDALKNLEHSMKQFTDNNIIEFISKKDEEKITKALTNFLKDEEKKFGDFQITTPSGATKIIRINSRMKEEKIFHTIEDITNLKKMERVFERKNELIKILSHDLANSFIAILSAVYIFNNTSDEKMIIAIKKESLKGLSIIDRLEELRSTIEDRQNLKIHNLKNIFENIADQSQILIEITGEGEALADKLLPNVFENIINNATKHGEAKKIEITIEEKIEEHKTIVKIKNDGSPIEENIIDNIFQEGVKGKKTGNTGVGLSIVQKIVQRSGGKINVKNIKEGVYFILELQSL